MALTLQTLIRHLSAANPQTPVFSEPSRAAGTPEEVVAAFNELNRVFAFNSASNELKVNGVAISLSEAELRFVNSSVKAFNEQVKSQSLVIDHSSNGLMAPATRERVTENQGIRVDDPNTNQPAGAVAQPSSAGCTWQWWFNTYWWGFKLSFNSCAISWLATAGKALDGIIASFKLPAIVTPIVKLVALLLKPFDKGNGSTIYVTWVGPFWITAK